MRPLMKKTFLVLVAALLAVGCRNARRGQAQDTTLRSAAHPAMTTPPAVTPPFSSSSQLPWAPLSLVFEGGGWTLFSRGVNHITCYAQQGQEVWLGTRMGVKLIDRRSKTVRHFTRLEGLPDDNVVAIAAERDATWCLTQTVKGQTSHVTLCRFDRKKERWDALREMPRPPPKTSVSAYTTATLTLDNDALAVTSDFVCVAVSPVPRSADAVLYLFDKRRQRWSEVVWDPNLRADYAFLNIAFTHADRDSVWLGSNTGLLRYRLRERQWQRFLPDRMVWAGVSDDGVFYLANSSRVSPLMEKGWLLTRFAPKAGETKDFVRPARDGSGASSRYERGFPTGVSAADNTVWVTTWATDGSSLRAGFHLLDWKTEQWRTYTPQSTQDLDFVPDAALLQPTVPRSTLLSVYAPHRFPDWFCAGEKLPAPVLSAPERQTSRIEERRGEVVWTVEEGNVLVRTERPSGRVERFPLTAFIAWMPSISGLALSGDRLFAQLRDGIQWLDLRSGQWRKVSLPLPDSSYLDTYWTRLFAYGEHLWVGSNRVTLRYDPNMEQFAVAADYGGRYLRLFGMTEDSLWFLDGSEGLFRADLKGGSVEQAELNLPPDLQPDKNVRRRLVAVVGSTLWFTLPPKVADPTANVLIGYETKAKTWTEPLHFRSTTAPRSILGVGDSVYVATVYDEAGAVRRYDVKTRRWSVIAARLEIESGGYPPVALISVDDQSVWGINPERLVLWEFNRSMGTWSAYRYPGTERYLSAPDVAARRGDTIFVASHEGLWRFSVSKREWQRIPIPTTTGLTLQQLVGDEKAIWALCYQGRSSQYYTARFDKATNQWTVWGEESGFPERKFPSRLIADGETVWVYASNEAYRFDPKTNRWQNVSRALHDDPRVTVFVWDIVPDGESVWLLAGGATASERRADDQPLQLDPLVRYDKARGASETFNPEPLHSVIGVTMLVERDAVWVTASTGAYRFDKMARMWRQIEPPQPFSALPTLIAQRIVRADSALWFVGREGIVRWTGQ